MVVNCPGVYFCIYCEGEKGYTSSAGRARHYKSHHVKEHESFKGTCISKEERQKDLAELHVCPTCLKVLKNTNSLKSHKSKRICVQRVVAGTNLATIEPSHPLLNVINQIKYDRVKKDTVKLRKKNKLVLKENRELQ